MYFGWEKKEQEGKKRTSVCSCQTGNYFMEEMEFQCKCGSIFQNSTEDKYIQNSFPPFTAIIHIMLRKSTIWGKSNQYPQRCEQCNRPCRIPSRTGLDEEWNMPQWKLGITIQIASCMSGAVLRTVFGQFTRHPLHSSCKETWGLAKWGMLPRPTQPKGKTWLSIPSSPESHPLNHLTHRPRI